MTLHSYRYAWAERAKICGYPERFAQEALGHNSKAVHRAYAKRVDETSIAGGIRTTGNNEDGICELKPFHQIGRLIGIHLYFIMLESLRHIHEFKHITESVLFREIIFISDAVYTTSRNTSSVFLCD